MGASQGNAVSGSAAGSQAAGQHSQLQHCAKPLGTLAVFEDTNLSWWGDYRSRYPHLGSTLPVIRLMVQQSNCFVVVERGHAMNAMNRERELMAAGQLRAGSNVGGGQMVAADYTLNPEIHFAAKGTEGFQALGGALLGGIGTLVGGGLKKNEASTTLLLVDNRSGVQISAAVGNAGNYDFNLFGGAFLGGLAGGASGFSSTPEGKVITAAFADSYNQMVVALRGYRAQVVDNGLGKGGTLTVGGAADATPVATTTAHVVATAPVVTQVTRVQHEPGVTTVSHSQNYNLQVHAYDEGALEDYYDALKRADEGMGGLLYYTAASDITQHRNMALAAMNMFTNSLAASKIELESWPLAAKQEAWRVLGSRIEKYNKLFLTNRDNALKSTQVDPQVRSLLASIELITKESLFGS